jgi:hypothetical protein
MTRFRKRPVEIEAVQWHGEANCPKVFAFLGLEHPVDELDHSEIYVTTIHGETATVRPGDWIVREPEPGRFYPVKPDIFARSYEPAAPSAPADQNLRDRIASCPGYETSPNPCRCPCYGCKHHCSAHNPEDIAAESADENLRERIAQAALHAVEAALGDTLTPSARDEALAGIAAVLPAPADRATVLREAIAVLDQRASNIDALSSSDFGEEARAVRELAEAANDLRRMAGEAQQTECGAELAPRTGTRPCTLPAGHDGTHHQDKHTNRWPIEMQQAGEGRG